MRSARLLVKAAAAATDVVRGPQPGLVVLIYHRVGRRTSVEVDLPLELFEAQVRFLAEECRVVTLGEGLRFANTDPYRLARSPVQVSDGMRWFTKKVRGGMAFEDSLRRHLNRRRYTGVTT